MPAILTENGFIDSAADAAKVKLDAFLERIALGHARGIARIFQLSAKSSSGTSGNSSSNSSTKRVHLPASASAWRTYPLNVAPVKKNSDWSLTPAAFGGLTYTILAEPYPNVVTIQTGRGRCNIYIGPDTSARRL